MMKRILLGVVLIAAVAGCQESRPARLTFCCEEQNDLYRAVRTNAKDLPRFTDAQTAVERAETGTGVLILGPRTQITPQTLDLAHQKRLRLFIECPDSMPGITFGAEKTAQWERVVVSTDQFAPALPRMRILAANACTFRPLTRPTGSTPLLTLARVAGFDTAVYGLPAEQFPMLLRTADGDLLSTAPMSNFVSARYAPTRAWAGVWEAVLAELSNGRPAKVNAESLARPFYSKDETLRKDAEAQSLAGFAKWIDRSGLLVSPDEQKQVHDMLKAGSQTIPPQAPGVRNGDGSLGILEGFSSMIQPNGTQFRSMALRADCNAEMAMVLALHASISTDARSRAIAKNLLDYVYVTSGMHGGVRGDPKHPAFGLIAWGAVSPAWEVANYGDDNARTLLATMVASKALDSHAWDEAMLRGLLANLRTTGKFGFRGDRIDIPALEQHGWRHFHDAEPVNYALNFEAYLWACYLWAYRETGEKEFLDKARTAIGMTMKVYPNQWRWADNMERARILLPLAWLIRVDDTPEHRQWLSRVADDLVALQHECGAIPEQLGGAGVGGGHYVVPKSNEAYGTTETPLIQTNGDPVSDQLYTTGFALIGLHEAYAATGDAKLKQAADKLADYLVRIQVRSEKLPWLDGAWFRAFDFGKWDYWASSADVGWGAWSVEAGWCPAWIAATLGLRAKDTSMWDLTADSRISEHMQAIKPLMEK